MFGLTRETRVFLRTGATDLRLSFEGLRGLVVNVIRADPTVCGALRYVSERRTQAFLLQ